MTTSLIQLITLALAAIALVLGAWLLIVGKRPWRGADDQRVAPRVRLLGLSYMLVFGSAMIQIILEPRGIEAEALGGADRDRRGAARGSGLSPLGLLSGCDSLLLCAETGYERRIR